jgi:hypothetical protein
MNVAMPNDAKPKRKEKPKHGVWRKRRIMLYVTLIAFILMILFILTLPMCGCSIEPGISEFDQLSTEIKATNDAVAIQIEQTNIAIMQATPSP